MSEASNTPDLLQRGRKFSYFVEEILGIRLNKAQARIARILDQVPENGAWPLREMDVVAANQIGKTLIQACIMIWGCLYKIGVDPRQQRDWANEPYVWIHLGPVQQQAYHAHKDAKLLAKGVHPAQGNRSKLPKGLVNETKIEGYYEGFSFFNGASLMFRTAENKAEAILGYRAAAISVDEAAFVGYLTEVKNTVLLMRLIASGGPLFLFSTPNGLNDFYDQVQAILAEGDETEDMVWHQEGSWLVWAVITDNVGFGLSAEEVERMERTINPATKEQQLRGAFLEPAEAFFLPQDKIIEAFSKDLPDFTPPIPGHQYAIFFDPSIAADPTAAVVLDCTRWPWTGVYKWHTKPLGAEALIAEMVKVHRMYHGYTDRNVLAGVTRAVLGFDATSMGGAVMTSLLSSVTPKKPINYGGTIRKKLDGLTNLRNRLTKGEIILPASWTDVRSEVLNYRLKDDKVRQDLVMALMGADMVAQSMVGSMKSHPVNPHARITRKRELRWR